MDPELNSQVEAKLFAERVGFPIMLKGPTNGGVMAHSWAGVASLLSEWGRGSFMQRVVPGNDRCGCVGVNRQRVNWQADV